MHVQQNSAVVRVLRKGPELSVVDHPKVYGLESGKLQFRENPLSKVVNTQDMKYEITFAYAL